MGAIDYVNNYAIEHGIHIFRQTTYPTCSDIKSRVVLINTNEVSIKAMPFSIAHELGHIVNKDSGVLYHSSKSNGYVLEENANTFAIDLLYKYCKQNHIKFKNAADFMKKLGIPKKYLYLVEIFLRGYRLLIIL